MKTNTTRGFTIVELLTVMAVIAVLIGLLIPALNLVKDHAKQIQQRAQFHSIDVGLEMFKSAESGFGDYPDSFDNVIGPAPAEPTPDGSNYGGAQKLAEALVGWDLLGVHPKSGFRSDGEKYFVIGGTDTYKFVYDTTGGLQAGSYVEANGQANIKARKGPMIDLENANAYRMQDVYGTIINNFNFNPNNFVLCDVFAKRRPSAVKTGMPILYFKARTNYQFQDYTTVDPGNLNNDVYNYDDNKALVAIGTAETQSIDHELENGNGGSNYQKFEQMVLNPQVLDATINPTTPNGLKRPYRADTFILISAGKDGNYGTADDITNFETGTTE